MNSLSELRDFFQEREVVVTEFTGWSFKVGKDLWTLSDGVFYKNNTPQSLADKVFLKNYLKQKGKNNVSKITQTRKWRGISSRNYR